MSETLTVVLARVQIMLDSIRNRLPPSANDVNQMILVAGRYRDHREIENLCGQLRKIATKLHGSSWSSLFNQFAEELHAICPKLITAELRDFLHEQNPFSRIAADLDILSKESEELRQSTDRFLKSEAALIALLNEGISTKDQRENLLASAAIAQQQMKKILGMVSGPTHTEISKDLRADWNSIVGHIEEAVRIATPPGLVPHPHLASLV
jgi:hypothetical protein